MFKSLTSMPSASLESLPTSMQRAVKLMLSGAAATGVWGLYLIIVLVANKNDLFSSSGKKITSSELSGDIIYSVLVTVILAAVWVLMARMNQRGRNWARIVSATLFVLWSFETFTTIGGTGSSFLSILDTAIVLIIWLFGIASLFMLFRPDSSAFYKAESFR
jgi:hypothetical protein